MNWVLGFILLIQTGFSLGKTDLCRTKQENFNDCVRDLANSLIEKYKLGNKEIELPSFDPLFLDSTKVKGRKEGILHEMLLTNVLVKGLGETHILSVRSDPEDLKFEVIGKIKYLDINGDYKSEGGSLSIPLFDQGSFFLNMSDVTLAMVLYGKPISIKDERRLLIVSLDLDINPTEVFYHVENLVERDNNLESVTNEFFNENPIETFKGIKPHLESTFEIIFKNMLNVILLPFTKDEILPD